MKPLPLKSLHHGFSLIELMIVVSLIGMLAMIAMPSYQGYMQRARFTEVISIANAFKTAVSLALQEGAPLNEITHGKHGIPASPQSTKNLASLQVKNGIITATATALARAATYTLTPHPDGSSWKISGTCLTFGLCQAS